MGAVKANGVQHSAALRRKPADHLRGRRRQLGGEPVPMTPAEFGKLVAEETEKWAKVIRAANIKAE